MSTKRFRRGLVLSSAATFGALSVVCALTAVPASADGVIVDTGGAALVYASPITITGVVTTTPVTSQQQNWTQPQPTQQPTQQWQQPVQQPQPTQQWQQPQPTQKPQPTQQWQQPQPTQQQPTQQQPAQAAKPTDKVKIDVATVNGSGCPAGTAAVAVSSDNTAFTVTYSAYLVEGGVSAEKNCQLNMYIHVPSGYTYAVASADYRGFAQLAANTSAALHGTYYFAGGSATAYTSHPLNGPRTGNWQFTDRVDYKAQVWHPCGAQRNLNINTRLTINANARSQSYISMDSTDVAFSTVYNFSWGRC